MTTNLTFTIDERKNVLKVPNAALRFTPQDANGERTGRQRRAQLVATDKTDNEVANRLPRARKQQMRGAMLLNRTGRSQAGNAPAISLRRVRLFCRVKPASFG